ncbi:gamma-glutamylcyclotransferase family protein [Deinococcus hopiensis]|uniref:Putative gamma-glutamylcyclotransferase n=1 Tax=Deinococcus hopiensis KR-140 TaxID=695939 RepID=A0A1W1V7J0_9DEIO|nr:gamma-glutamylcyclotransferase family protein [Deinococcus hopiensis]SMB89001.1 Uncharacterized conserved protein YtfP, gamma-glutamylcyclotransferase (GGCT)/AIG2-like family [Deinococcus hopiensis KR-140]
MTAALLTRVFVYGTLRPGERNAAVARRGGTFTAVSALLSGYRLLHLLPEAYPGVVPGAPEDTVLGEVLTYAPADWDRALPFLDELEGVNDTPPLYIREQVTVGLEGGRELSAWVYVYADTARLSRPGVRPVPEGDWRMRKERDWPQASEH